MGWCVATGFVADAGEVVIHEHVSPMVVEFVHAFPHRVELWAVAGDSSRRLVSTGAIDDAGHVRSIEWEHVPDPGQFLEVLVDILGVDAEALA